jgi:hypothetical protein
MLHVELIIARNVDVLGNPENVVALEALTKIRLDVDLGARYFSFALWAVHAINLQLLRFFSNM